MPFVTADPPSLSPLSCISSGINFPELCHRLIAAVEQVWDVENEPTMLYVGCEVTQWRDSRRIVVEGPPVMKLREAEYLWQVTRADRHAPPTNPHHRTPQGERPRGDLSLCLLHALSQTSSYIIWPAAAKALLARLPVDCPTDCYISKLVRRAPLAKRHTPPHTPRVWVTDACVYRAQVLEGHITAVVACPALAEQRDPYAKGDIKHTNIYKWQVEQ